MNRWCHWSLLFVLLVSLPARSDDRQKAQKLLSKVTAMASDPTGKRAVSLAVSDMLSVSRAEISNRRRLLNLNYGDVFLAYYAGKNSDGREDIFKQVRTGKTVWQIATDQQIDWKQLTQDAKKLNSKVDDNLLRHFANRAADSERNTGDGYNPYLDAVKADLDVSKDDMAQAESRYAFLQDHAAAMSGGRLDITHEKAVENSRGDPIRNGGPQNPDVNTRPGPN
jgi:hypothetical protein